MKGMDGFKVVRFYFPSLLYNNLNLKNMENIHYVQKLKNEISELNKKTEELDEEFTNIMKYLSSDKFIGFENNYINAKEVYEIFRNLREINSK